MAPRHVAMVHAGGVVLEEEMVFPIMEYASIGIIQPVLPGREVKLRAILFGVC